METGKNHREVKPWNSFSEQLDKLKLRKMYIHDEQFALAVLKRINYYRFTAYALTFRNKDNDSYIPDTTFANVYDLYEFDRKLRHLLVGILESIEISFRTRLAYASGYEHGPLGYQHAENFVNEERHIEMLKNLQSAIRKDQEIFIEHHLRKYDGQFPVWVAVELLSFGAVSKFYANLKTDDQFKIASEYYNTTPDYLSTWLRTAVHIRNICAHYGRLYNKFLKVTPKLHKRYKSKIPIKRLFTAIFILRELCSNHAEWSSFVVNLEALIEEYSHVIDLHNIGFPQGWCGLLRDVQYNI